MVGVAAEGEGPQPRFLAIVEEEIIPEHMETYMQARVAGAKLNAEYEYEFP